MSFYKEVPGRQTTLESTLKFDTTPTEGSTNPVTSGAVKEVEEKADAAAEALQEQINEIAEKAGSGYIPKGEASVATLNALSGQENGDLYTLTDAGTLTDGSLAVVAGDTVAWDETNSVWYKAMNYAPAQYGTNEVHNLPTTITAFRTGDVIPVDGPSVTAKIGKDDLLKETAENALDSGIASAFNTSTDYNDRDIVVYEGALYRFNTSHSAGAWDASEVSAVKYEDLECFYKENIVLPISSVTNGKLDVVKCGNFDINGAHQKIGYNEFILNRSGTGNKWSSYAHVKRIDTSKPLFIRFKAEATSSNTNPSPRVSVQISSGSGSYIAGEQEEIEVITLGDYVVVEYDPSTHPTWTTPNVWVTIRGAADKVTNIKVTGLCVYQVSDRTNFTSIDGDTLDEILAKIDEKLSDNNVAMQNVVNGTPVTIKSGNSDIQGAYQKNADGSFIMRRTASGNKWSSYVTPFVPVFENVVKISFDIEPTANNTNPNVNGSVYVSNGRTTYASGEVDQIYTYKPLSENHVELTFDPTYYQVYFDPAWTQFNVWFSVNGVDGVVSEFKISNVKIWQNVGEDSFVNFSGNNVSDVLKEVDNALSEMTSSGSIKLVAPDGGMFLLAVNTDGTLTTIPAIPSKAVFFGNSLLLGSGTYGMAASDDEHDYYYLINDYITSNLNNSFTASRYSGTAFESITNPANISSNINSLLSHLVGDESLVIVQLGDNVNTSEKLEVFKTSCKMLLSAIRNKCNNARVVWLGMWYGNSTKYSIISNACFNTGCDFVSMIKLNKKTGASYIGAVQKKTLDDYTMNDVSAVTDIGGGYIKVEFSVSGDSYEASIPVNSYSLVGTTLSYNGEYTIVSSKGVASHPGDVGMKDIANLFLYQLEYSQTEKPIT